MINMDSYNKINLKDELPNPNTTKVQIGSIEEQQQQQQTNFIEPILIIVSPTKNLLQLVNLIFKLLKRECILLI